MGDVSSGHRRGSGAACQPGARRVRRVSGTLPGSLKNRWSVATVRIVDHEAPRAVGLSTANPATFTTLGRLLTVSTCGSRRPDVAEERVIASLYDLRYLDAQSRLAGNHAAH